MAMGLTTAGAGLTRHAPYPTAPSQANGLRYQTCPLTSTGSAGLLMVEFLFYFKYEKLFAHHEI